MEEKDDSKISCQEMINTLALKNYYKNNHKKKNPTKKKKKRK